MTEFETPNPINATIDVVVGDVRILASYRESTNVDVRPSDPANDDDVKQAEQTRVEYDNGRLLVKAPKVRSWLPRTDGGSIDVTVELPAGSNLNGSGRMTDFRVEGRLGDARIKTGMGHILLDDADALNIKSGIGDIAVERVTGHAEVTTGSGDVRLRELADTGVIKNSNGDTWIGAAAGELRVNAANGNIAVDLAQAGVVAKSANGDVRLGEVVRNAVVLETSLGDLEVGIREGTAAWLDVRATAGKVHNALEATDAPEGSGETVEVRARTTAGDVLVRRP
jgi:DUF4097 and DUF4098 domain-containing protein YvlB